MKHLIWLGLGLLLSGCIPLAMMRPAAPVHGNDITVGASALIPVVTGSNTGGGFLPYLAFARGDGETEFNLSTQLGIRAGLKQKLTDGFSVDVGAVLPFLFLVTPTVGLPIILDGGLIIGLDAFYLSPRVQWLGFSINNSFASGLLYQVAAGFSDPGWIAEAGVTIVPGSGALITVSGGLRF
jgi:hypothetical protein